MARVVHIDQDNRAEAGLDERLFLGVQFDSLLHGRDLVASLGIAQADDLAEEVDLCLVHPPELAPYAGKLDGHAMDGLRCNSGNLARMLL
jgi:hypothetical protein